MKNIFFDKNNLLWVCLCLFGYISPAIACLEIPQNPPDMEITTCIPPDNLLILRFKNYDTYGANPGEYCACALNLPFSYGQVMSADIVHAGTDTSVNGWEFSQNSNTHFPSSVAWQGFSSAVDVAIAQGLPVDLIFCIIPSCEPGQIGCCEGEDIIDFFQSNSPIIGTGGADPNGFPDHHISEMPVGNIQVQGDGNVGIGTNNPLERLHVVDSQVETTIAIGQTSNNINGQIRTLSDNGVFDRLDLDINVDFDPQFGFIRQNPNFSSWCNSMSTALGGNGSSFDIAYALPGNGFINWQTYMHINQYGDMYVMGEVSAQNYNVFSDFRFKENINNLENALKKVRQLRSVSYTFKQADFPKKNFTDKKQIGFIAQEIQEVFPELVKKDKEGYLSVNYTSVIPVLTEAIKELDAENSSVRHQNEALQQQIKSLEERMKQIELLLQKK